MGFIAEYNITIKNILWNNAIVKDRLLLELEWNNTATKNGL